MGDWLNGTRGYTSEAGSSAISMAPDHDQAAAQDEAATAEQLGAVRIARRVLRTVVAQAALGVPGVAGMASFRPGWRQVRHRTLLQHGVALAVQGERVSVELYLIVAPGASFTAVGTAVQEAVGAALEHILGLTAGTIDIYIQDVS